MCVAKIIFVFITKPSKLTVKKINKCRTFITSFKRYKNYLEEMNGRKYKYSELNTATHSWHCLLYYSGHR